MSEKALIGMGEDRISSRMFHGGIVEKPRFIRAGTLLLAFSMAVWGQQKEPLSFVQSIPLPGLHDGDFDQFAVDLPEHRLFVAAEENSVIEVIDLRTNVLIHTIADLKAPHSMLYRPDVKKLFVADGGAPEVKIYQGDSYKLIGAIKLEGNPDLIVYDPSTQHMFVTNSKKGDGAQPPDSFISVVDTSSGQKLADIKVDSSHIDAMALEKGGPRLFVNISGKNAVGVIDREKRTVIATWSVAQEGQQNLAMAFDETNHRLFTVTRKPSKLVVLDSDSGTIISSLPCVDMVDGAIFDTSSKRVYVAGTEFVDVFQERDVSHFDLIAHVQGAFRAKTAILIPQINRFYLAVPHRGEKNAEVRVFKVQR
jgi:DNA-binding beta-propeller fold protein YncE